MQTLNRIPIPVRQKIDRLLNKHINDLFMDENQREEILYSIDDPENIDQDEIRRMNKIKSSKSFVEIYTALESSRDSKYPALRWDNSDIYLLLDLIEERRLDLLQSIEDGEGDLESKIVEDISQEMITSKTNKTSPALPDLLVHKLQRLLFKETELYKKRVSPKRVLDLWAKNSANFGDPKLVLADKRVPAELTPPPVKLNKIQNYLKNQLSPNFEDAGEFNKAFSDLWLIVTDELLTLSDDQLKQDS